MPEKNYGGQAFPSHNDASKEYEYVNEGMTLLDWFAGQVMIGLVSNIMYATWSPEQRAEWAYKQAGAMTAESAKQ